MDISYFFKLFISASEALPTTEVSARKAPSHSVNCLTECLLLKHAAWYHVQFCNGLLSDLNVLWLIVMCTT